MRPILFLLALAPFLVLAQVNPIIDSLRKEVIKKKDPKELCHLQRTGYSVGGGKL